MSQDKVAIYLRTEGKEDVKRDFREIGDAGEAYANRTARAVDKASRDIERSTQVIEAETRKQAAAYDKIRVLGGNAFLSQPTQSVINARNGGAPSATDMGATYTALIAQEERLAAGAAALRAQLDPVWAAQQRFNNEMAQARTLIAAGVITLDEYCDKLRLERSALDQLSQSHIQVNGSSNAMRAGMQNLGFQAQDFIVQVLGGTDALRAFAMQAPQAIGAIQMMAINTEGGSGKFAAFAKVLGGSVGIALGVAIPLVVMLGEKLWGGADAADGMAARQAVLAKMIDQTTGRLKEQNQALVQNQILQSKTDAAKSQSAFNDTRQQLRNMRPGDVDLANIARFAADTGQTSRAAQMLQKLIKDKPWLADQAASMNNTLSTMTEQARTIVQSQAQARLLGGSGRPGDARRAFGDFSTAPTSYNMTEIGAQAKLAAAVTAVDKAQAQLTLTRTRAEEQLKAGKITQAEATAQIASAERQVNQAQAAEEARRKSATAGRKQEREEEREREAALRKILELEKERNHWVNEQSLKVGSTAKDAISADGEKLVERQKAFRAANDDISAGNILLNLEWELRGRSRREIEAAVELRRYQLDLERDGRNLTAEQVADLVRAKAAQIGFTQAVDDSNAKLTALRDIGSNVVDSVLNPSNWTSWKNVALGAINDVVSAMWKMAVINPIQNRISGSDLPTLGSLFGLSGKKPATTGGSAIGNLFTPAGAMLVGENGPEIVNMPRGARVMTASDTRRALGSNDNGLEVRVIKGDLFDVEVRQISAGVSADVVGAAAPIIATGASNGAQQAVARRNGRRLA